MASKSLWRLVLVVILVCAAATALISTLAQGMAAGDQMGVAGQEPAIKLEQHRADIAALIGVGLELLAGLLVFPWIAPGERSKPFLLFRFLAGVLGASLVSGCLALAAVLILQHR